MNTRYAGNLPLLSEWVAMGMTTAPRSQVTIHATLASLRRAGFSGELHVFAEPQSEVPAAPGVIRHRNPVQLHMWQNWLQAARYLLDHTAAPFLLLMEDDFEVARGAAERLAALLSTADPRHFGLASLYTAHHLPESAARPARWLPLGPRSAAWGSLGYCFSRPSLLELLKTRAVREHRGRDGTDDIVSRAMKELGREIYAHYPSLSCHTGGDCSTVGHQAGGRERALGYRPELLQPPSPPRAGRRGLRRACLLMPFFGECPPWFDLFLETCRWNPHFDWLFFTDLPIPPDPPANVRFVAVTLDELRAFASARLDCPVGLHQPYKLCDLRPMFGQIFQEYLTDYEFFGWGDLDVVYGDLARGIPAEAWRRDVISFHQHRLSGHLCLFRNAPAQRELYRGIPDWRSKLEDGCWRGLDDQLSKPARSLHSFFFESFNTPHVGDHVWTDGSQRFPSAWTWREGRLTNDLDGEREFPYFHFMVWKGGKWGAQHGGGQWERLPQLMHGDAETLRRGCRISAAGFHAAAPAAPDSLVAERRAKLPAVQSLWIGDRLGPLEQLCVASFLEQGHPFDLYVYNDVAGLPNGTQLRDAAELMPQPDLLRIGFGHMQSCSDLFRYKLLHERGGWWVDMDMLCVRPLPFAHDHVYGWEDNEYVNGAALHAPRGSSLMRTAFIEAHRPELAAHPPYTGPRLLTSLLKKCGGLEQARPVEHFYPVHWRETKELLAPWRPIPQNCYTVHAWRTMWRYLDLDVAGTFPATSVLGQFQRRLADRLPNQW